MGELADNTLATVLVLLSALIHATWNAWLKRCDDKLAVNSFYCIIGGSAFIPLAFFVPLPSLYAFLIIALSTVIHCLYQLLLIQMLDKADFTVGYPVARGMGPLIVTVFSLVFWPGDLNFFEVIAIFTVVFGIMMTGLIAASGRYQDVHRVPGLGLALLVGLCIGSYTLVDSYLVRMDESFLALVVWMNILFAPGFIVVALQQRGRRIFRDMIGAWRPAIPITVLAFGGYMLALLAFRLGSVAEVAALRETSIVFAALIGFLILKEQYSRLRLLSSVLIAIGAVALKMV